MMHPRRVLLTSIGSRGDVQPVLALALSLRSMGHAPSLCVPPNYEAWVESFGLACFTVGPDLKAMARRNAVGKRHNPSWREGREIARHTTAEQFSALMSAARGCELIVVAGPRQTAARSIAEAMRIPYVYAAYCPIGLPSPNHPPPRFLPGFRSQSLPRLVNRVLWTSHDWTWNFLFRAAINEQRAALGLRPIDNVSWHVSTDRPLVAADALLAPSASSARMQVTQTGAWLLPDATPLPEALERFLAQGEPPVYFGFGSMQVPVETGRVMLAAARAVGRRAILSRGWAELARVDEQPDHICIGDVSHGNLFPRVAAIVHHGGAGTTTAAARAGTPQVVIPQLYDQYYWAHRVRRLGIGSSLRCVSRLSAESAAAALRECLTPGVAARARELASRIELHGARIAAERLMQAGPNGSSSPGADTSPSLPARADRCIVATK